MPNQNPLIPGILIVACAASTFAQEGPKSGSVVPVVRVDPDNGFPPSLPFRIFTEGTSSKLFPAEFVFFGWSGDTKNSTLYGGYAKWQKASKKLYWSYGGLIGESYHFNRSPLYQGFAEALVPTDETSLTGDWLNVYFSSSISGELSGWERGLQIFAPLKERKGDGAASSGRFISPNEMWLVAGVRTIDLNESNGSFTSYHVGLKGSSGAFSYRNQDVNVPKFVWTIRRGLGGSAYDFDEWAGALSFTVGNGTQAIAAGFSSTNRFSLTYTAFTRLAKRK